MTLTLVRNRDRDLTPLASMLPDAEIPLLNPNAKVPFDEMEWHRKWLGDREDVSFYLQDTEGRDVGFFALREGIGPEVRHLTYVFLAEEARGGAAQELTTRVANPMPGHKPFHELDNVTLTPHMSGWTNGTISRRQKAMASNIDRLARGERLQNPVA